MEENKKYQNIEVETDFKDVAKNPKRWFGLVYPFFIVMIIVGGLFFIKNMGTFYTNDIKPLAENPEFDKQPIPKKKGVALEGVDVMEISKPDTDLISKGEELYQANCASCHGDNGKGDGIAGASLNPPPRNFLNTEDWVNEPTISGMYKTLEEGIDGGGMVAYDYLPVDDRFAMIHYIRTFADDYPEDTEDDLKLLDQTYSLSEGRVTPNTISMDTAEEIILNENNEFNSNIELTGKIIRNDASPVAVLLKDNLNDCSKMLSLLMRNDAWKENTEVFKAILYSGIPYNGFKVSFMELSERNINLVFNYLMNNVNNENVKLAENNEVEN